MKLRIVGASALLWSFAVNSYAVPSVPEIDGTLSLQAIGLLAGVIFLMKKKKQ